MANITTAGKCWTRFLNLIALFPNSIVQFGQSGGRNLGGTPESGSMRIGREILLCLAACQDDWHSPIRRPSDVRRRVV